MTILKSKLTYCIDLRVSNGPSAALSTLYHYILEFISNQTKLVLYLDSNPTQNKNQMPLAFLCDSTKIGKQYPEIILPLMISGHTKFAQIATLGSLRDA
jgi:hypothetical protein